jgi:hypothetical protein
VCLFVSAACVSDDPPELELAPGLERVTVDFGAGPVEVVIEDVDGWAVLDGDIGLGPIDDVRARSNAAAAGVFSAVKPYAQWPEGRVIYEIDDVAFPPGSPAHTEIELAIETWNRQSIVRFVERNANNGNEHYVLITFDSGLGDNEGLADIGNQPGALQYVWLGETPGTSLVVHELGHTIGLFHEQSRNDRDAHVQILWDNIVPGQSHNFLRYGDLGIVGLDVNRYDYASIMHYASTTYSDDGEPTIMRQYVPGTFGIRCNPLAPQNGCLIEENRTLSGSDIAGATRMVTGDQGNAARRYRNEDADECIRPAQSSMDPGTPVIFDDCTTAGNRRWYPWLWGQKYLLINYATRHCLAVHPNSGLATQEPCTGVSSQKFTFHNSSGGAIFIKTNNGSCLRRLPNGALGIPSGPAGPCTGAAQRWFTE